MNIRSQLEHWNINLLQLCMYDKLGKTKHIKLVKVWIMSRHPITLNREQNQSKLEISDTILTLLQCFARLSKFSSMLCFVRQAWTCLSTTLVVNFVRRLVRWARRMKSNRVKCERGDRRAKVSPRASSNKRRKSDYLWSTVPAKRCRSKVNDQWAKESF